MYGGFVYIGDFVVIGIEDFYFLDFGDVVLIKEGEVFVFWVCGVIF